MSMTKYNQIIVNVIIGISAACGLLTLLFGFFLVPRALFGVIYEIPTLIIHMQAWLTREFNMTGASLEWGPILLLILQSILFLSFAFIMNKFLKVKEPGLHGLGLPDDGDLVKSEYQDDLDHNVRPSVLIGFIVIFLLLLIFGIGPYFG